MIGRPWLYGSLLAGILLLACSHDSLVGTDGGGGSGGGGGGGGGGSTLKPATFNASVNPIVPPGYSILGDAPYRWQAFVRYNGVWVAVGVPQVTESPSALLVIDCNDPGIQNACTLHRSAMIQVTIAEVSPGPALLCSYKSGFQFRDDFFLNTPLGHVDLAPAAVSSLDPANEGICFP